jgi:hypothetical protein
MGTATKTITPIPTYTKGPDYNAAYWGAFAESYIREGGNAEFWRLSIEGKKLSEYYRMVSGNPFWLVAFFRQLETVKTMKEARAAGATFETMVPETKDQALSPAQFVEKAWREVPAAPTADKPLRPATVAPTRKVGGIAPALPTQVSTQTSTATSIPTGTPVLATKTRTPNWGATAVAKTATAQADATRWAGVTPTIHAGPANDPGRAFRQTLQATVLPPTATPSSENSGEFCTREATETPWNNGGIIIHGP